MPPPIGGTATAGDFLEAYLAGDRRRALASGTDLPDRATGAVLFADISGFTPLTEALAAELGPQRGAEELAATLNTVVSRLLDVLDDHGGNVIYFSGDAVTCWLDGDDGVQAARCGVSMQDVLTRHGRVTTPAGTRFDLGMKVAVAVGAARRFVVGDPDIQRIDVLAGAVMDRLAEAEGRASRGEVVLDDAARQALSGRVRLGPRKFLPGTTRTVARVDEVLVQAPPAPPPDEVPPLPPDVVREWLLPAVYERLNSGRGEFLADLRPGVPLFLRFGGIDYDNDPDAAAKLDDFVRKAQRAVDSCGGSALQLTIGDKGSYLYAVFGSPLAHEDDAARACSSALALLELERDTPVTGLTIGIAKGRLRSGTYGSATRRTFCCLGDPVNLAARLMTAAEPGQIYVTDAVRREAGRGFAWEGLDDLTVKGKAEPVHVHRLLGEMREQASETSIPSLVGRRAQLSLLQEKAALARSGHGQVVAVVAEAGMGKTRLLQEATAAIADGGTRVVRGETQSFGMRISYAAWRPVWSAILGIEPGEEPAEQLRRLEAHLADVDPRIAGRAPLLGAVLGLSIPDNEVTASLDPQRRKASLETLLAQYLARRTPQPLAVVIEDSHWLDPLSRDLLDVLARSVAALPVLIVLTSRPEDAHGSAPALERLPHFTRIDLPELDEAETAELVGVELGRPAAAVPSALRRLVAERCGGNPFYVGELLRYLVGRRVPLDDAAALRAAEVPDTLYSMVLSRIDVLPENPRRTIKVASVIGRAFTAATVAGCYPELGSGGAVRSGVAALAAADLVVAPEMPEDDEAQHEFKHIVVRDVAYESIPFAQRTMLHQRVGNHLESISSDPRGQVLDVLAHHFWLGDDEDKKRSYVLRAGKAAQEAYANEAAVDYYERVAPLLSGAERAAVLLDLGGVLELTGEWKRADEAYGASLALAEQRDDVRAAGWARARLAEVARKQGSYGPAADLLAAAERDFTTADDDAGTAQVLHLRGTLMAHQGAHAEARAAYSAALEVRTRLGEKSGMAALLSNLAIVAEYEGDYATAAQLNEEAFALRTEIGDRWGIGVSRNNLGMIALLRHDAEAARRHFEASLAINTEIGDQWMTALGHHNLANAFRATGDLDAARASYLQALDSFSTNDDAWALANLFEDIAVLACTAGHHAPALRLLGVSDALRDRIGSPRTQQAADDLAALLAPARDARGDADVLVQTGRRMSPEESDAEARRVCLPG